MHRVAVVTMAVALLAAPAPGVAASLAPATATFDFSSALMLRLFGEVSDSRLSLAAAYGDRASESPMRDLALRDAQTRHQVAAAGSFSASAEYVAGGRAQPPASAMAQSPFDVAQTLKDRSLRNSARFVASSLGPDAGSALLSNDATQPSPSATFTVGEYQPVAPLKPVAPQPGTFSFGAEARGASPVPGNAVLAFNDSSLPAGASASSAVVPATVRVGPIQVRTRVGSATANAPQLSLQDTGYDAGANFDVRAGARTVNVDLSSNYERLTRNDTTLSSPALGASSWQLPNDGTPLVIPNYADLSKVSVGAAVAVPVVHGLTLNLNYGTDRMFGGYGLPGLTNLDATDNSYGGVLTFEMPHSSSTLSISAKSLRYQDNILPSNTFTQTREDVNFTVKF